MNLDHIPGPRNEHAVIGLGKSGRAVAELLIRNGLRVYASDATSTPATEKAAGELRALGVDVDVGTHDLFRIRRAQRLVVSPGVPPTAAPLVAAREAGVKVVGEI